MNLRKCCLTKCQCGATEELFETHYYPTGAVGIFCTVCGKNPKVHSLEHDLLVAEKEKLLSRLSEIDALLEELTKVD